MKTIPCPPGPNLALALAEAAKLKAVKPRYTRKTIDEWTIQGQYAGWEDLCCYDSRQEARADLKAYRENDQTTSFRLVKRRVRKG